MENLQTSTATQKGPIMVVTINKEGFVKNTVQTLKLVNTFLVTAILVVKLKNAIKAGKKDKRIIEFHVDKQEKKGD